MNDLRMSTGESEGTLEQVFLKLTEEQEEERAAKVAERFGQDPLPATHNAE